MRNNYHTLSGLEIFFGIFPGVPVTLSALGHPKPLRFLLF